MTKRYLIAVGPEELIRALGGTLTGLGVQVGEPRVAEGFADAVDSPIGPEEVKQIAELISIVLPPAISLVVLLQKIKDLLSAKPKPGPEAVVISLKEARTGKTIVTIDANTDVAQAAERIEAGRS